MKAARSQWLVVTNRILGLALCGMLFALCDDVGAQQQTEEIARIGYLGNERRFINRYAKELVELPIKHRRQCMPYAAMSNAVA